MRIYYEQFELLARQTRQGAIANVIAGFLVLFVMTDSLPMLFQIVWAFVLCLAAYFRIYHVNHLPPRGESDEKRLWVSRYIFILFLVGTVWGILSVVAAIYVDFFSQLFLLAVILGITSAGITTMAVIMQPFIYYLIGSMGLQAFAFVYSFYAHDQGTYFFMALLALTYTAVIIRSANEQFRTTTHNIQLNRELDKTRAEAEKANEAKSEFLSSMSHELRTPLNAIIGFSDLLILQNRVDEETKANVQHISNAGHHLLQLVDEVLDLSQIETGQLSLSMESVELKDVLDKCHKFIEQTALEKQINLEVDIDLDVRVHADYTKLKQAVINILSNAVKYNKNNGLIELQSKRHGDSMVRISITDTGAGIPEDMKDKLFTPFERLGAENTKVQGTGIGLSITKQLIEAMDGKISYESEAGKGSSFFSI